MRQAQGMRGGLEDSLTPPLPTKSSGVPVLAHRRQFFDGVGEEFA
jgi:hypothetical protein